jgi:hypothetical protein
MHKKLRGQSALDVWKKRSSNLRKILKGWDRNFSSALRKARNDLSEKINILEKKPELTGLSVDGT